MSITSTYIFPWDSPTSGDRTALIYFNVQDVVFTDFHCSECSMSVFQRPISPCILLLSPEEEEGMGMQSPQELQGSMGAVGAGPWQRVRKLVTCKQVGRASHLCLLFL